MNIENGQHSGVKTSEYVYANPHTVSFSQAVYFLGSFPICKSCGATSGGANAVAGAEQGTQSSCLCHVGRCGGDASSPHYVAGKAALKDSISNSALSLLEVFSSTSSFLLYFLFFILSTHRL